MKQEHRIARLLRALAGKTQEQIGEETGVHPSLIAQIELGKVMPSQEHLEKMAKSVGLTVSDAEGILRLFKAFRSPRVRRGECVEDVMEGTREAVSAVMKAMYTQMLGVPMPCKPPDYKDHQRAAELCGELEKLSQEERLAVVQSVEECQSLALLEKITGKVEEQAPSDITSAVEWAQVAQEIAAHLQGPEDWCKRVREHTAESTMKALGGPPS